MTDPPRVGRGVREGGQFKAQHLIAALQLPGESNYIDDLTSQEMCKDLLSEVAETIGASAYSDPSYGRSVLYRFGRDEECEIHVWIDERSGGFRVYGSKRDEDWDKLGFTKTESTEGIDVDACKAIMYCLALEVPKMSRDDFKMPHTDELSAKEDWDSLGFNEKEAQGWTADGFSPSEAADWREAGFRHKTAIVWLGAGFSASQAKAWRKVVPDVSEAGRWVDIFGFDPDISLEWRKQKLTPDETEEWCVSFGPGTARAKIDAGISFDDAYEAMIAEKREVEKYYKAISETQNGVRGL